MSPQDLTEWLVSNQKPGYAKYLAEHQESIEHALSRAGISLDSQLAYPYLHYGSCPVKGWYELNEADTLEECTEYARRELGVSEEYVALTSVEGQGITLYSKLSGAVFDVEFGQFEQLAAGGLHPVAASVVEFLYWCRQRSSAGA